MKDPSTLGTSRTVRIFIVDDHALVRRGLRELIADEVDLEVCGDAAEAAEAAQQVKKLNPDLVIVDLSLQSGHGMELIKQIKGCAPHIRMLVSSMHDEAVYAERVLHAGASGYVGKHEAPQKVIEAIRAVMDGKVFLSSRMTERLLGRFADLGAEQRPLIESLSDRELEVFELIGEGQTTRQVAEHLKLSVKTIESYRENIKTKLYLKNTSELTRQAVQWRLEDRSHG